MNRDQAMIIKIDVGLTPPKNKTHPIQAVMEKMKVGQSFFIDYNWSTLMGFAKHVHLNKNVRFFVEELENGCRVYCID